ncbi:hypothetical protein HC752_17160 [Vibrio sp. S9_S30]|uniref:hypothetical protein n=1 Tax=Vibrio sp. S9_S30 TaxID=2720226 RepID=UPI001680881C|nr:hypothetical protein [Vibrio sp. S9_S30]MBD1558662.1 hypothetical protein [Vibrio sp. S9_S30]
MKSRFVLILGTLILPGCATTPDSNDDTKSTLQSHISNTLKDSIKYYPYSWTTQKFNAYLQLPSNKAFAVHWKGQRAMAFGFASGKLSIEAAKKEALFLCSARSTDPEKCKIAAFEETAIDIDTKGYPVEVSSIKDIETFDKFNSSNSHSAIAGNQLGLLGFANEVHSQSEAEDMAMRQCLKRTHYTLPKCKIIASK